VTGLDHDPQFSEGSEFDTQSALVLDNRLRQWEYRNAKAYSQIFNTLSPSIQTLLCDTADALTAWTNLLDYFESENPAKVRVMRKKYESCQRKANQSMVSFVSEINDLRKQVELLGETIADPVHAAKLLRNLPESLWTVIGLVKAGDLGMGHCLQQRGTRSMEIGV